MSATYFPQINSNGVVTQMPYKAGLSFNSIFQPMPNSRPYSFAQRAGGLTNFPTTPLGLFNVQYLSITDAEVATLSGFFDSMAGRFGAFEFLDPDGNLVNNSENFSNASWTGHQTGMTVSATGISDPFGGTRATTITGSSGSYTPIVIPDGYLPSGYVLCASAYAKATTGGQSVTIGFSGISTKTWSLPYSGGSGSWERVYLAYAVGTGSSSAISMQISFNGAIQLFGPCCQPLAGPGNYSKSPDNLGLHKQCRFDVDAFKFTKSGPNQNSVVLPIREIF